jgi:hypothetical protein
MHSLRSSHLSDTKPEKLSVNTNLATLGSTGGYVMYVPCYVSSPTKLTSSDAAAAVVAATAGSNGGGVGSVMGTTTTTTVGNTNWPSIVPLSPSMHHVFALPLSPRSLKSSDSPLQTIDFPMLSPGILTPVSPSSLHEYRPPRPPNSFILFRKEQQAILRKQFPKMSNGDMSKEIAKMWKSLSPEVREIYVERSHQIRAEYTKKFPSSVSIVSSAANQLGKSHHHHHHNTTTYLSSSQPMSPTLSSFEFLTCNSPPCSPPPLGIHHYRLEDPTNLDYYYTSPQSSPRAHGKPRRRKSAAALLGRFCGASSTEIPIGKRISVPGSLLNTMTTTAGNMNSEKLLHSTTSYHLSPPLIEGDSFDEFDGQQPPSVDSETIHHSSHPHHHQSPPAPLSPSHHRHSAPRSHRHYHHHPPPPQHSSAAASYSMNELSREYIEDPISFNNNHPVGLLSAAARVSEPPSLENLQNHPPYDSDIPDSTMSFSGEFDPSTFLTSHGSSTLVSAVSTRGKEDLTFMIDNMLAEDKEFHSLSLP